MALQLTPFDRNLLNQVRLNMTGGRFGRGIDVPFQFPPVIKSDNKGVEYDEINYKNIEPLAIFKSSNAREISMEWVYMVTGGPIGDENWTAQRVSEIVKGIRGYFYATTLDQFQETDDGETNNLIIKFSAYDVVGTTQGNIDRRYIDTWTFRSDGINIRHSDTVITDGTASYPLRTDLSMKLKLWSRGEVPDDADISGEDERAMHKMRGLERVRDLTPEWF